MQAINHLDNYCCLSLHPNSHLHLDPWLAPGKAALERLLTTLEHEAEDDPYTIVLEAIELFDDAHLISPEEGLDRARHCSLLAGTLYDCYQSTDCDQLLIEAIDLERKILSLRPPGHTGRAYACTNLALSLHTQFLSTGNDHLLVEIIDLQRESLSLHPPGDSDRAGSCGNLASSLWQYYEVTGNIQLLTEAIDLERESLSLCPVGHPDRETFIRNLAVSLSTRYQATGDDRPLTEAIALKQELILLHPPGHPDHADSCASLASSLKLQYERTGDDQLVTQAISLERESLILSPAGDPQRAQFCGNLANSLKTRYMCTGDDQLLIEAIDLHRESLSLRPRGHPERALSCENLASSIYTHYRRTGDEKLVLEAIDLLRESLSLCPPGNPHRAGSCLDLGNALRTRYESNGDERVLIEAIRLERESLSLLPLKGPDRITCCENLSMSLWMRYRTTGDYRLLSEALDLAREALSLRSPQHHGRALSCSAVALLLYAQYDINGDVTILSEAINLERESLALRPSKHPDHALSCSNLAESLRTYYKSTDDDLLLTEAIELERNALSLCSLEHPDRALSCGGLAISLMMRYKRAASHILLDEIHKLSLEGISLENSNTAWRCVPVLVWLHLQRESRFFNVSIAIQYLARYFESHPDSIPEAVTACIDDLNLMWSPDIFHQLSHQHRVGLIAAYRKLIAIVPFLNNPVLDSRSQLRALRLCRQVGPDACVNAILAGEWTSGLEELEVARGLLWSQRLHYRDPLLTGVPANLATGLEFHMKAVSTPSMDSTASEHRDTQHNHVTRVFELLRDIRTIPGLERFMLGETFHVLHSVASACHPVVVLVGAHDHYYALLLQSENHQDTVLSLAVNEKQLHRTMSFFASYHRGVSGESDGVLANDDQRLKISKDIPNMSSLASHRDQMRYLWVTIVRPVLDGLGLRKMSHSSPNFVRPRLHWCLTGAFTSLPVHAAGIYEGLESSRVSCADYVVSSYTPTLTTLLRAQRAAVPLQRKHACAVLVAEKQAQEHDLPVLQKVDSEVAAIAAIASSVHIRKTIRVTGNTTISGVCEAIQGANIAHLACHGIQDGNDALQSGFCLGNGRLTISNLMELKLDDVFLAFLSACETAKGDKDQPDQAMHLAAAMLFTGFKTVIATMWAIYDDVGHNVAKWFYAELFAKEVIDGDAVAYALDAAIWKLRDSGASVDQWAPFIQMGL